ncbi:hypothetical protein J4N02_15055 [Propioniciclava sp. MC1595]|uniref:hypothetical protein n=1 Tax=Propioniciclava sp. MC1595 TaxID=2760308 RepID=UPI0016621CC0|nr:hypothetical protein [Propioniciclava sp. MC1595]MBB1494711.1 hypothetical protein [Propioniciclava sp. MC1595]QTE25786.1 hypothetical protein J4N02_15055 [Propioniciclava sp. MC1595]
MESPPFPVPARGWRLDESGITYPRGLIPWSEVAEVTQAEDGDDVTHVQAVLRTTTTHRVVSGVVAVALLGLAVVEVVIGLTSGLEELPLVALFLVIAGGLMAWAAILLVHQGWRSATITLNDVVVRSPFMRRWVPLAKVFAFQHYSSSLGRRTCGVLYWLDEPGRRSARLALPGSDPEYRLPALDAYVRGLRPQAPR